MGFEIMSSQSILDPIRLQGPPHPEIQTQTDPVSDAAHLTHVAQQLKGLYNLRIS